MSRVKINLIGGGFQHSPSTSGFEPLYITWVKDGSSDISIYVDNALQSPTNQNTKNYGWLCESKTINPHYYRWCLENIENLKQKFIKVFTHDVELSKTSDIFQLTQCSGKSFISLDDAYIYKKDKLVSMIASNKTMCQEHMYRQEMILKYSKHCDHFGRGFIELPNVIDGLKNYCFSFVLENATYSNMFTEKITNCFMCGTIPIYYGMENIGDFFNTDGIIILNDDFDIKDLSFDLYKIKFDAVVDNFERAKSLLTAEDYIYLNYIKDEI